MAELSTQQKMDTDVLSPVADIIFAYLRDVIYNPNKANLDLDSLPPEFLNVGKGLLFYSNMVQEARKLARALADGNLHTVLPPPSNEIAAPLKMLHASLKHLTWQSQQVAKGDYRQRVDFMGDFSESFNNMIQLLEEKQKISMQEKSKLEMYVDRLLANTPDPILLFDKSYELVYVSDSFLQSCGSKNENDMIGKTATELFASFLPGDDKNIIETAFSKVLSEKHIFEMEREIDFNKSGSPRHYHIKVTPLLEADGSAQGFMALMHDTTDLENALKESKKAREIAETTSRAKSDFLARMSHEMRTPMNTIIGKALLHKTLENEEDKYANLDDIEEAAKNLLFIINNILDMTQVESQQLELVEEKINLTNLIEQATAMIKLYAAGRNQNFTINIGAEVPDSFYADNRRLTQVLSNLLNNAVKFTPDNGSISLNINKMAEDETHCVIRYVVSDTGVGIAKDKQGIIFQTFEQVDGGFSREFGGTGIGLSLCKSIVEMMGGAIWVDSDLGKGSAFYVEIPMTKMLSPNEELYYNDAEFGDLNLDTIDGIFDGLRALLTDDVDMNREIVISLLEDTGIIIDEAENGKKAVTMFASSENPYDIVFMDLHMPQMDGFEATKQIRECDRPGADIVPILAITANNYPDDIARCFESGMNSHISKPVDMYELIMSIRKLCRR